MSDDDIRQRLAAVEGIDWNRVKHERQQEFFSDWILVGPMRMHLIDDHAQGSAVVEFLRHASADIRRLLDQQETAVTNPIYGPPPEPDRGEPIRLLADAIEVMRPNGTTVVMDLVALADVTIGTERALAALREENGRLRARIDALETKATRQERAGRVLAGVDDYEMLAEEHLANRVQALEQRAEEENLRVREGRDG